MVAINVSTKLITLSWIPGKVLGKSGDKLMARKKEAGRVSDKRNKPSGLSLNAMGLNGIIIGEVGLENMKIGKFELYWGGNGNLNDNKTYSEFNQIDSLFIVQEIPFRKFGIMIRYMYLLSLARIAVVFHCRQTIESIILVFILFCKCGFSFIKVLLVSCY